MRVETGDGDPRVLDSAAGKEGGEKLSDSYDLRSSENRGNVNERNMRRDQRDSNLAPGEAHRKIVYAAALGKELGLAGKGEPRGVQPSFRDGTSDDRLDFSGPGQRYRFLERFNSMLCRSKPGFSWCKCVASADDQIFDSRR